MKRFNKDTVGFEGKITADNYLLPGFNRYGFTHISEFKKTRLIQKNTKIAATELIQGEQIDLSKINVKNYQDQEITAADYFSSVNTDGLLIMKNDQVVHEEYNGFYNEDSIHIMMSATKSFAGLMLVNEIKRGNVAREDKLSTYITELATSGFGNTTVGQLLDMQLRLQFSENYADPKADIWEYSLAAGLMELPKDYNGVHSLREALSRLDLADDTNNFLYTTPITDVVNWVLERVTGKTFTENLRENLYAHYGFERDAQITVDKSGVEVASGGLNMSLRDAARVGQLMAHKGEYNGFKFLEPGVIDELVNADKTYQERYQESLQAKQPGKSNWYYKDQIWVMNTEDQDFAFIGVYGQVVYVNLVKNIVMVKQGSNDLASDDNLGYQVAIMQQIASQI